MGMNVYLLEVVARARLAELRALSAEHARAAAARPPRPLLREVVGRALIRAGTWIAAPGSPSPTPHEAGAGRP
ncbi:MAG: hypothetical protein HYU51_05040 [Candidatus Rokubacteria bacterium]|nr:hypothetical protein [Candidatus Rokubacteria bacterium]